MTKVLSLAAVSALLVLSGCSEPKEESSQPAASVEQAPAETVVAPQAVEPVVAEKPAAPVYSWNEEPPKKISVQTFVDMGTEMVDENQATYEAWYRHFNQFGAWDYYCYKDEYCFIGSADEADELVSECKE